MQALDLLDLQQVLLTTVVFCSGAGLSRATVTFPSDIDQELKARFLQAKSAFIVLDQVVNKLLAGERSTGLGKIGKGFFSMFSDKEVNKLRTTLAKARAALSVSALMFGLTVADIKSDSAGGIGFTALAAILEVPDPIRGGAGPQPEGTLPMLPPKRGPLPPTPVLPVTSDQYAPRVSSRRDLLSLSPGIPSEPLFDPRSTLATHHSGSSRSQATSQSRSDRSSVAFDSLSDTTDITSVLTLHQQMDYPNHYATTSDQIPKQAIRLKVDPSKAPRWRPKHTGHVPDSSIMALASAIQQKDHKMTEQLLDCGVSVQAGLLGISIANHDLQTLQLLLAFGAEPGMRDPDGLTPLHIATKHAFLEAAQLLIKYGAQPNTSAGVNGETPLAMCFTGNRFNFAMLYLQHFADCNAPMSNGETPFTQAMNTTTPISVLEAMLVSIKRQKT